MTLERRRAYSVLLSMLPLLQRVEQPKSVKFVKPTMEMWEQGFHPRGYDPKTILRDATAAEERDRERERERLYGHGVKYVSKEVFEDYIRNLPATKF